MLPTYTLDHSYSARVILRGFVPEEILPKYYAACDIFISSTFWEGFGLPFVEVMATGKPVIGFDATAISELIINGYNGYKIRSLRCKRDG